MRIFIVARGYPTKENPILGIFEFNQAKALKAMGHEVIYIAVDLRSIRRKRKLGYKSFIKEGINIEEISAPIGAVPRDLLVMVGSCFTRKILKRAKTKYGEPVIIHAHFLNTAAMVSKVITSKDVYIITEHSSMLNQNLSKRQKKQCINTYIKADALITVSKSLQKRIKDILGLDSICVNNMIDTKHFNYDYAQKAGKGFAFVTVSSLTPNKRVDLMIRSFAEFIQDSAADDAELYIIGDGEERERLQSLATQLGVDDKIRFYGVLEQREVRRIFDRSDCFVLTSKRETFGVACAEALLSGIPVIITKCGGPEEFVNKENGIIAEDEEISEAMLHMYTRINDYDEEKISKMTYQLFSEEKIVAQLEKVYNEAIKNARPRVSNKHLK